MEKKGFLDKMFGFFKKNVFVGSIDGMQFDLNDAGDGFVLKKTTGCKELSVKIGIYNAKPTTHIAEGAFKGCSELTFATLETGVREIGKEAFCKCTNLQSVRLAETITRIEDGAFCHCDSVEEILLPEGLTYIGKEAFAHCEKLKKIHIPYSVTYIGEGAFSECLALQEVRISAQATEIPKGAFYNCVKLRTLTLGEGIPAIGEEAFFGCIELEKLRLPDSVACIGKSAFGRCDALAEVVFPQGLKEVGAEAFYGCEMLKRILLPESLEKIGSLAFELCSGTEELYIPGEVSEIGGGAFSQVPLAALRVSPENKVIAVQNESVVNLATKTLIKGSPSGEIPGDGSITRIASRAFDDCETLGETVFVPEGITVLEPRAFFCCMTLTKIHLPSTLVEVGDSPFGSCGSLREICVAEGNPRFYMRDNCLIDREEGRIIFGLPGSRIPQEENIRILGEESFSEAGETFTEVYIPLSVQKIRQFVFAFCNSLASIRYEGTRAQWKEVEKSKDWNSCCPEQPIHCADGDAPFLEK